MKRFLVLACLLAACSHPPSPGPAIEKVNGMPTAKADDAVIRGEDHEPTWDDMLYSPKMPIVYFDLNSSEIRPADVEDLSYAAMAFRDKWSCQVDGHASEEGTTEYNLALGLRRAHAVGSYLAGFEGITVIETSYGEECPAATPKLSRRVEIRCR